MKKRHELVSEKTLAMIYQRIFERPGVTSKDLSVDVALSDRTVRAATKQLVYRGLVFKRKSLGDLRHSHFYPSPTPLDGQAQGVRMGFASS